MKIICHFRKHFLNHKKTCQITTSILQRILPHRAGPWALELWRFYPKKNLISVQSSNYTERKIILHELPTNKSSIWIPTHYKTKSYVSGGGSTISGNSLYVCTRLLVTYVRLPVKKFTVASRNLSRTLVDFSNLLTTTIKYVTWNVKKPFRFRKSILNSAKSTFLAAYMYSRPCNAAPK